MIQQIRFILARKFVPVSRNRLTWFKITWIDGLVFPDVLLVLLMVVIMIVLVVVVMVDLIDLVSVVGMRLNPGLKVVVSTLNMSSKSSYSSKYEVTFLWCWVSHLVIGPILLRYLKVQLSWIQNRLITCDLLNDVGDKVRLETSRQHSSPTSIWLSSCGNAQHLYILRSNDSFLIWICFIKHILSSSKSKLDIIFFITCLSQSLTNFPLGIASRGWRVFRKIRYILVGYNNVDDEICRWKF